jgi:hypothetical protein
MKRFAAYLLIAVAGSLAAFGFVYVRNGQASTGKPVLIEPARITLQAKAGSETKFSVTVTNLIDQPVKIVGANRDCNCLVTDQLPIEVAGRGECEIDGTFLAGREEGPFVHQIVFYVESGPTLVKMPVSISGNVVTANP